MTTSTPVRAIICAAVCALLLTLPTTHALEGMSFVDQRTLELEDPTCMSPVDNNQIVLYDDGLRQLVFLDLNLREVSRVGLDDQLGYKTKCISSIVYDSGSKKILAFSAKGKSIIELTPEGKVIRSISLAISTPHKLSKPNAFAVDPSGMFYVSDHGENDIKAFSSQGIYLYSIHIPLDVDGDKPRFRATGIAVTHDGSISAIDPYLRNIISFSREGRFLVERPMESEYGTIEKLVLLDTGDFLGFDDRQKIYKWDPRGKLLAALGTRGTGRGQFSELADVICDGKGRVMALDGKDRDIQTFSFQTLSRQFSALTQPPKYRLTIKEIKKTEMSLIELIPGGAMLYAGKSKQATVLLNGKTITVTHPEFSSPSAGIVTSSRIYIFDRSRKRTFAFNAANGIFEFDFGHQGVGRLDDVTRILEGPGNTLFFADEDDTKVKVFSSDGIFSASFGKKGNYLAEEIGHLRDMCWHRGDLAILDSKRKRILVFDTNGSFLRSIGLRLPDPNDVDLARIASDKNGFLILLDAANSRVLVIDDDGKVSFQFGSRGKREQDFGETTDFTVSGNNHFTIFDKGRPSRLISAAFDTPGPLGQAEIAIYSLDWGIAGKLLKPFLDPTATKPDVEAMRLALAGYAKSDGKFLTANQVERARDAILAHLKNNPASVPERIALADSFRQDNDMEAAISVLRQNDAVASDPRCAQLLAELADSLESSGKAKTALAIVECEVPVLLSAIYQNYYKVPAIRLTLSNNGGRTSPEGKALFFAKAVMDGPTETILPPVKPFSRTTILLKATFNRNILSYVEKTRLAGEVEVEFGKQGNETVLKKNLTFGVTGRNSIDWSNDRMITCFITPKDPDVQTFLRAALKVAEDSTSHGELDQHLYKALTLFDAMQSLGMYYLPDPKQPFNFDEMSSKAAIDYLQFPRETLLRKSGDCDDLSVLYAAMLEGAGIPAVLITSPGHIFAAFQLQKASSIGELGLSEDLVFEHAGATYVPVETTRLGSPFISAWRLAATTIKKYSETKEISIIDLKENWATYPTVPLPPWDKQITMPDRAKLKQLLSRELEALNLRQVEKRLAVFKKWLARDPKNLSLLMLLSRSYASVGVFDQALKYAEQANARHPNNADVQQALGNIAYMQNHHDKAISLFKNALKIQASGSVHLNMALAYLKSSKLSDARNSFAKAKKMDPELIEHYEELAQLLE